MRGAAGMDYKRANCPNCLPDGKGKAYFTFELDINYDNDTTSYYWKCQNCHYLMPKRKYKPTAGPTKSQLQILNKLKSFGGQLEYEMIGRKVFVSCKNYDGRKWFDGQSLYGTIFPKGKFDLTLQRFLKDVKLTDDIDLKVYAGIQ
jgi:hypothetical protein